MDYWVSNRHNITSREKGVFMRKINPFSARKLRTEIIAGLLAVLVLSGISFATIVGSRHDLSISGTAFFTASVEDEICIFCHTPHNADVEASDGTRLPLWNRDISRNELGFTVYSSSTLNATPGQPGGYSQLCMSCHDGVTAVNALLNYGRNNPIVMGGGFTMLGQVFNPTFKPGGFCGYPGANIGGATSVAIVDPQCGSSNPLKKDFSDDHPVSFVYDNALATSDGGLVNPVSNSYVDSAKKVPLYAGKLECSS